MNTTLFLTTVTSVKPKVAIVKFKVAIVKSKVAIVKSKVAEDVSTRTNAAAIQLQNGWINALCLSKQMRSYDYVRSTA